MDVPAHELRAAAFDQTVGGRGRIDVAGEHDRRLGTCPAIRRIAAQSRRMCRRPMPASMMPRGAIDRLDAWRRGARSRRRRRRAAKCRRRRKAAAAPVCMASSTKMSVRPWRRSCERDFRAAAVGRHRQQQRSALHERRKLAPAFGERLVVTAVGAIHQRGAGSRRRIVGVERSIPPKSRRCRESRRRWRSAARRRRAHGRCGRSRRRCRARRRGRRPAAAARRCLWAARAQRSRWHRPADCRVSASSDRPPTWSLWPWLSTSASIGPMPSTSGNSPGGGPSPRSSISRLPAASSRKQAGPLAPTPEIKPQRSGFGLIAFDPIFQCSHGRRADIDNGQAASLINRVNKE